MSIKVLSFGGSNLSKLYLTISAGFCWTLVDSAGPAVSYSFDMFQLELIGLNKFFPHFVDSLILIKLDQQWLDLIIPSTWRIFFLLSFFYSLVISNTYITLKNIHPFYLNVHKLANDFSDQPITMSTSIYLTSF